MSVEVQRIGTISSTPFVESLQTLYENDSLIHYSIVFYKCQYLCQKIAPFAGTLQGRTYITLKFRNVVRLNRFTNDFLNIHD